jgi:pimeloyl-ACP methyl ester carboxylesterase
MDTYADDVAAMAAALDLQNAVHVGHSTGGGEVARYLGRHGTARAEKAVLIGAVPPVMVKSDKNPADCRSRSSTSSARRSLPTGRSSTKTFRPPFTAITEGVRRCHTGSG